ncbi:hypothetical protein ACSVBT_14940 [Afipia sp. TerB]
MTRFLTAVLVVSVWSIAPAGAQTPQTKPPSGDPAASSATSPPSNPSGSGTSTSGGKDANNDQGRDKMGTTGRALEERGPSREPAMPGVTGQQKSGTNAEGTIQKR